MDNRKLCGCGCGQLLEPRVDGERQKLGGKEVNEDCYFRIAGEVVERHPVHRPGTPRRAY